MNVFKL
jgi:hypothetical protein